MNPLANDNFLYEIVPFHVCHLVKHVCLTKLSSYIVKPINERLCMGGHTLGPYMPDPDRGATFRTCQVTVTLWTGSVTRHVPLCSTSGSTALGPSCQVMPWL